MNIETSEASQEAAICLLPSVSVPSFISHSSVFLTSFKLNRSCWCALLSSLYRGDCSYLTCPSPCLPYSRDGVVNGGLTPWVLGPDTRCTWVLALLLTSCVTLPKWSNFSAPQFLCLSMGVIIELSERIKKIILVESLAQWPEHSKFSDVSDSY